MKIGEALIQAQLISREDLTSALADQEENPRPLGEILLDKGLLKAQDLAPVLARHFQIPFFHIQPHLKKIPMDVIDVLPADLAERYKVFPVAKDHQKLRVAIANPLDVDVLDTLRLKTGLKISPVLATEEDIQEAIEYAYHNLPRMKDYIDDFIETEADEKGDDTETEEADRLRIGASNQPVIQYVRSLIIQAVNCRASDVHIQPKQDRVELRLRIDGILTDIEPPPKAMLPAITTRIKILSGLDIAERRLPQDGRFRAHIGSQEVDVRTSTFPTIFGESVVLRLLDTSQPLLSLEELGFEPQALNQFRHIISQPYGLILVTGPTGSGKTTTLYTALNAIQSPELNIITLEDPVEYRLPFIQQSQVNPQIGFTFARGLRSILRQDPDVIMVGEIRDAETAEIALHAALTGHLVLSTLHTNDAAGAAVRLIKMGIEPYLISSCLLGVVAQRLIRKVCPHCRETYTDETQAQRLQKSYPDSAITATFSRGKGCDHCQHTGYFGREGLYEIFVPDEDIRQMILQQRSASELSARAQEKGMKTMAALGLEKLQQGITTVEEFLRVTRQTQETG